MDPTTVTLLTGLGGSLIGAAAAIGGQWSALLYQGRKERKALRRANYVAVRDALDALDDALLTRPPRINIVTMPELSGITRALAALPPGERSTGYLYRMRSLLIHAHAVPADMGPVLLGAVNSAREVVLAMVRGEKPTYSEQWLAVADFAEAAAGLGQGSESSSPEFEWANSLADLGSGSDEYSASWRKITEGPGWVKPLFEHWRRLGMPVLPPPREPGE